MGKGIVSCGYYIPYLRIRREEYMAALGGCAADMEEKAVLDIDEDVITMAVEAARNAAENVDKGRIGALVLASTNFPYQEKYLAGTLVEALGLSGGLLTSHHSGSALAGAEAFLAAMGLLDQTDQEYALAVISDAPSSRSPEGLEHGFGAAACAFVLAGGDAALSFEGVSAQSGEFMGLRFRPPADGIVRDIGVPAYSSMSYIDTVAGAVSGVLEKLGRSPGHYRHLIMPQADLRADQALAKKLGFSEEQLREGTVFRMVGDAGCCTPFLGLCKTLEGTGGDEKTLVCTYGAGSGSIAMSFRSGAPLPAGRTTFSSQLGNKKNISYIQYLKLKKIL